MDGRSSPTINFVFRRPRHGERKINAAVVLSAVGSLTNVSLRFANQKNPETLKGHFKIVSLSGTLGAVSGSHLHMSVAALLFTQSHPREGYKSTDWPEAKQAQGRSGANSQAFSMTAKLS